MRSPKSRVIRIALLLGAVALGWLGLEAARIGPRAAAFVSDDLAGVPATDVGLVLGTSPSLGAGRPNAFFSARIAAAAQLFRAGKVRHLLVSGDNGSQGYDEPSAMRRALVRAGVPEAAITRDFAGFRTLDSMLRAKEVFGLRRVTVVSQRFHVERAVFLARAHGLEAYGFAARDVGGPEGRRVRAREVLSRLAAVLDVRVLHSRPRFTGPPVALPL